MSDTVVTLKTIADIETENIKFYIDAYQRGYRWTESEVKDLLDDIHEFSQSPYKNNQAGDNDRFYCLQPIIVTQEKEKGAWKVIDGQQRLTTLYLIYLYYINTAGKRKPNLPFDLQYNNKERLEEGFKTIQEEEYYELAELIDLKNEYEDDIDCFFVISAYEKICEFFSQLDINPHTRNQIEHMKEVLDSYVKIIWYELIDCDENMEIAMFTKINMGKIPLTNAELIKALLLRNDGNKGIASYQENIAVKWDEMEARLSDPGFWSFLVNRDTDVYSTRIDFIFDIMAHELNERDLKKYSVENPDDEPYYIEKKYNRRYYSFYVFNNYVRYLKKHGEVDKNYIQIIWDGISEYYRMFSDWYQKRRWYHMIGYIVETAGNGFVEKIRELSDLYKSRNTEQEEIGHKTFFEKNLREIITQSIDEKQIIKNKQELQEYIQKLEYGKANAQIRRLLLLYNICSLELLEKKTDARFPFDKYKNKDVDWDIEHINAVADDRPIDEYDTDTNACLVWLKNAEFIPDSLCTSEGINVKQLIKKIIENKLYLSKNESGTISFVSVYESVIGYFDDSTEPDNTMANLTLLDSGTNRSYKNDIFPLKRKKILENCIQEVYVPLCTKNVFLKAYIQAADLLKWTKNDKDAYVEDIVDKIAKYLILEDTANGQ